MESESNNQIDRLLRQQGRTGRTMPASGNGHAQASAHLDADELNAFAANAAPPLARARYVNHLADCADCRRLATDLAVAANPTLAAGAAAVSAAPASSIWQRLTSWIKPPTLRYAGPVLAVLCVATIMGVVLRTQYGNRIINEQAPVTVTREVKNGPAAPAPTPAPGTGETTVARAPHEPAAPAEAPRPDSSPADVGGRTGSDVFGNKESDQPQLPSKAPEAAPPPAPPSVATKDSDEPRAKSKNAPLEERKIDAGKLADSSGDELRTQRGNEDRRREAPSATSAGSGGVVAKQEQNQAPRPADAKKTTSAPAKGGPNRSRNVDQQANQQVDRESNRLDGRVTRDGADDGAAAGSSETSPATRSVSGRQFRRQGDTWIDTGYVRGYGTTNVKRGSEQYRALVADEPGLRTVAEQLSGEVIVVWKGRAYRFK
jgi:hypothetical protein